MYVAGLCTTYILHRCRCSGSPQRFSSRPRIVAALTYCVCVCACVRVCVKTSRTFIELCCPKNLCVGKFINQVTKCVADAGWHAPIFLEVGFILTVSMSTCQFKTNIIVFCYTTPLCGSPPPPIFHFYISTCSVDRNI